MSKHIIVSKNKMHKDKRGITFIECDVIAIFNNEIDCNEFYKDKTEGHVHCLHMMTVPNLKSINDVIILEVVKPFEFKLSNKKFSNKSKTKYEIING